MVIVKKTAKISALLSLLVVTGCASLTEVQKGAIIGGAAGAVTGAVVEDFVSSTTWKYAAVGALGGGLIGALVGDYFAENGALSEYETQIADLTKERDDLAERLRKCEADKAALTQEVADLKRKIAELERRIAALTDELNAAKGARVEYTLANEVLFDSGRATITAEGRRALNEAAGKIKEMGDDKFIQIEGHTDSDPIRASNWKSNWELGAARALAVLHYLEDNHGIKSSSLSAATYSMYKPVASNDTADGKSKNRRTVIVVYTKWPTN
jgi:chemotaxis protein MotB